MPVLSAGLLLYRRDPDGAVEVLLGHMGGPFWAKKDAGAWSIPKGEVEADEDPFAAARRELTEELGVDPPEADYTELGSFRQSSAKVVRVWAVEADLDPAACTSATFELEWPPRSGQLIAVPEIVTAPGVVRTGRGQAANREGTGAGDRCLPGAPRPRLTPRGSNDRQRSGGGGSSAGRTRAVKLRWRIRQPSGVRTT